MFKFYVYFFFKLLNADLYQGEDQVHLKLIYALAPNLANKKSISHEDLTNYWNKSTGFDRNKPIGSLSRLSDGMNSNEQLMTKNGFDDPLVNGEQIRNKNKKNKSNNMNCLNNNNNDGGGRALLVGSDRTFRSNMSNNSNSTMLLDGTTDDDNMFDSDFPTGSSDRSNRKFKRKSYF